MRGGYPLPVMMSPAPKFASPGANSGYNSSIVPDRLKEVTTGTTPTLATADESFAMPAGGFRYEQINGEIRCTPPAGSEHGAVIMNIGAPFHQFVKAHGLGVVCRGKGERLAQRRHAQGAGTEPAHPYGVHVDLPDHEGGEVDRVRHLGWR